MDELFGGAFGNLGVIVWGKTQPDHPGGEITGLASTFQDVVSLSGLAPGTYRDLEIDLGEAFMRTLPAHRPTC